ncbi:hypothetical protein [Limosilactobacillus fermentum]|uniref:hypothetical protein n=2 Tax=Limosilactobacillus fermentum TaxID=1613 RepID=UPI0027BA9C2E|nr:hypothetical protein [Limosilactobacillus fermentum]WLW45397.1 hypothetical protein RA155_04985 [Limosilactobacillus fermentum]
MGAKTVLTNDAKQVVSSDGIILTGIGTYQSGMTNFMQRHLIGPIRRAVEQGVPLLGIGLDMELLFDYSTEGGLIPGLGLIKGRVTEIPSTPQLPVPIVGWNMNRLETRSAALTKLMRSTPTLSTLITSKRRPKTLSPRPNTGSSSRRSFTGATWSGCSFKPKRAGQWA